MAQSGFTPIQLYRSATPGAVLLAGSALLRAVLILWGVIQDGFMRVPYTDVDYKVCFLWWEGALSVTADRARMGAHSCLRDRRQSAGTAAQY